MMLHGNFQLIDTVRTIKLSNLTYGISIIIMKYWYILAEKV